VIVYGRNPVREALRGHRTVAAVWADERAAREPWLRDARPRRASDTELAELSGSPDHQGVCAEVSEFEYADPSSLLAADDALVVCLDQVTDPRNLGAVCRAAEGAGAAGVVIGERRSAQVTAVVCRSSAGAVEHLPVARVRNLADYLRDAKAAGAWVYGASTAPEAVAYDEPDYGGRVVLVLGSEGRGLRPRVAASCDRLVALPMRGRVGSLNVASAAAALLYGILHLVRPGLTGLHKPGKLAPTDKA
jgi:23S rRNA (guanosine2251-2'-O)-methyltransferase